ncbi:hypothetical protein FACS189490_13460 [Clostridia bacterium]|nr:hypothetical protein FACS189490_13460 [Clostridia bacterium]
MNATTFSEGLSLVKTDSTWGYIDTTGKLIIDLGNDYEYVPEYGASDSS